MRYCSIVCHSSCAFNTCRPYILYFLSCRVVILYTLIGSCSFYKHLSTNLCVLTLVTAYLTDFTRNKIVTYPQCLQLYNSTMPRAVHHNHIHMVIQLLYMGTCTIPSALKGTVAHKTVPMFGCFGQTVLVQSDDIINGLGSHVQCWIISHRR